MQRRTLIKAGLSVSALLAAAGAGVAWIRPGFAAGRITTEAEFVCSAVARAVLDTALPQPKELRQAALRVHLTRMSELVLALPAPTQTELSNLLALLASAPGRLLLAGLASTWADADSKELQLCLERLRLSPSPIRQQIYHALRDLTNAAFYAEPSAWPLMGYPGPQSV